MSRWTWVAVAGLLLASSPASASYIGIFTDPNASSCGADVGPNPRVDLHIVAILDSDEPEMTGAQFQIVGVPATWTPQNVLWVPDTGTVISLGNPAFVSSIHPNTPGVNVTFHDCKVAPEVDRVPLGRLVLLGPPTADNVHLQVAGFYLVPNDPPSPMVTICGPGYEKVGIGGGEIVLNGPAPNSCAMAVEERTWTNVKALYRD